MTSVTAIKEDGEFHFDTKLDNRFCSKNININGVVHYVHVVPYGDETFFIYYKEQLIGDELDQLEENWRAYCKEYS